MTQEALDFTTFNEPKAFGESVNNSEALNIATPLKASWQDDLEDIEIKILGRKFSIKLEGFSKRAKEEIFETFEGREVDIIELLRAYLSKVQESCTLNDELEELAQKLFLV